MCEANLDEIPLICKKPHNLNFFKFVSLFLFSFIDILLSILRLKLKKDRKKIKYTKTTELIETIIALYSARLVKLERKKLKVLYYRRQRHTQMKISFFMDNLQLCLLRNYLYRILNKYITKPPIRNLVKKEILKAPTRTFSEFIQLFNEIRKELNLVSILEFKFLNDY